MKLFELWVKDVKTKEHPPVDLFASGTASQIVSWLRSSHKDQAGAMSALNFYVNRAGKNLSTDRKAILNAAKKELKATK